jgi:hypothetical protein
MKTSGIFNCYYYLLFFARFLPYVLFRFPFLFFSFLSGGVDYVVRSSARLRCREMQGWRRESWRH